MAFCILYYQQMPYCTYFACTGDLQPLSSKAAYHIYAHPQSSTAVIVPYCQILFPSLKECTSFMLPYETPSTRSRIITHQVANMTFDEIFDLASVTVFFFLICWYYCSCLAHFPSPRFDAIPNPWPNIAPATPSCTIVLLAVGLTCL